jgi:hypothetical protein
LWTDNRTPRRRVKELAKQPRLCHCQFHRFIVFLLFCFVHQIFKLNSLSAHKNRNRVKKSLSFNFFVKKRPIEVFKYLIFEIFQIWADKTVAITTLFATTENVFSNFHFIILFTLQGFLFWSHGMMGLHARNLCENWGFVGFK